MSTTPTTPKPSGPPAPTRVRRPGRRVSSRVRTREAPAGARGAGDWIRSHGLLVAILAALVLSALSLLYPSTPSYDPWAWIIWGREITQWDLVTTNGPSWKPLPVLFTTPFALAGDDGAPALWLLIARASGLLAFVMAYRLGSRLAGPWAAAGAWQTRGKVTVTTVPAWGALSISREPPWRPTRPWTTDRPRPVPSCWRL